MTARLERFVLRSRIGAPAARVFDWHLRPGSLEKLIPPWERLIVTASEGRLGDGARVVFRLRLGPVTRTWVARHEEFVPGRQFVDVQISGPFAAWRHLHLVEPDGPAACWLTDRIDYALPLAAVGRLFAGRWTRRKLERLFRYRHEVTARENEGVGG